MNEYCSYCVVSVILNSHRIKSIKKDLRRKEEDSKIKMIRKEHLKQLDPYRTKRLGKQP